MSDSDRFDRDPEAIAWARAKVQHYIDKAERFSGEGDTPEAREQWRRIAVFMRRSLLGGQGCVMGAFDTRRPALLRRADGAVEAGAAGEQR